MEGCKEFKTPSKRGFFIVGAKKISKENLLENQDSFRLEWEKGPDLFIPSVSAWPLSEKRNPSMPYTISSNFSSPNRIYAKDFLFSGNVVLFFIKENILHVAIYDPPHGVRIQKINPLSRSEISLPWMTLKIQIRDFHPTYLPYRNYVSTKPNPGDKNRKSALALEANGVIHWLTSGENPKKIPLSKNHVMDAFLGFRTFLLPWSFRLERFKMDTDPGTKNPASYESFVNVQDPKFNALENAHIYMNNPLKKGKYTFYQASYFPAGPNQFGSVLQVNYDPGRFVKYAGSLILVLGITLHFYIRRSRRAKTS